MGIKEDAVRAVRRISSFARNYSEKTGAVVPASSVSSVVEEVVFAPHSEARILDPDLIEIKDHHMRYYPGFSIYAADWNSHVMSEERAGVKKDIEITSEGLRVLREIFPQEEGRLKGKIRDIEIKTLSTAGSGLALDKRKRKTAKKELGTVKNALDNHAYITDRKIKKGQVKIDGLVNSLRDLDVGFALGGDARRIIFFALEKLRGESDVDVNAEIDRLFSKAYSRGLITSKYGDEDNIGIFTINYYYISMMSSHYSSGVLFIDKPSSEKAWEMAYAASDRQIRLSRKS